MSVSMTSQNISFDEKAFIESVLDRYYNEENAESFEKVFDDYFRSFFPDDVICEAIRNKYYLGSNYDSVSLYSILSNKVDDALYDEDDSIADTEEFEDIDEDDEFEGDDYD